jgi:phosphoribosylformylglycinamidine cyclo-ligase
MPSAMRLFGALGGIEDDELRATFNGGIGMVAVVAPDAVPAALAALGTEGLDARPIGEVTPIDELGGRYAEGPLERLR